MNDTNLLDWLSKQETVSFKRHYNGDVATWNAKEKKTKGLDGTIDFFSCPSQHIKQMPTLRDAIAKAMVMDLSKKLAA